MASCHVRLTSLRSVEESTTSCASYGRLSGHCLKMRVKHWSRRSSPVGWTTATLCSSASRKDWCTAVAVGSERRRPSGDWYSTLRHNAACSVSYIGCRYARASVATLVHRSLSGISPSYLYPTTAVLSPMFASDDYVPQLPNMRCDVDTYCIFRDRGFAAAGPGL